MLSLAGRYDTAVLVSGDEDFVYAVNAVAYKGCRVEIVGFRSNTAPKLIDVADCFIDLGEIAEKVRKEFPHGLKYEDRDIHVSRHTSAGAVHRTGSGYQPGGPPCSVMKARFSSANRVSKPHNLGPIDASPDFIRVTDDQRPFLVQRSNFCDFDAAAFGPSVSAGMPFSVSALTRA
jgi:hypothetical protein